MLYRFEISGFKAPSKGSILSYMMNHKTHRNSKIGVLNLRNEVAMPERFGHRQPAAVKRVAFPDELAC